jgi:hypothetical protein
LRVLTVVLIRQCSPIRFADDVSHALWRNLLRVYASGGNIALIAGPEGLRLAVANQSDFTTQDHDSDVEIMGMAFPDVAGFLAAVHNLETLSAQVAYKRLAR